MFPKKGGPPPSRRGKRQLVVFLEPAFVDKIRARALAERRTVQEMIGLGMNAALLENGYREIFPVGHYRLVRRNNATAAPRLTESTTLARRGRASLSGWFDTKCLDYAHAAAFERGVTLQEFAEGGLNLVMKR